MKSTEEEYKKKKCCGPQQCGTVNPLYDHTSATPNDRTCEGRTCAAWRWLIDPADMDNRREAPKGYCGLAGAPL